MNYRMNDPVMWTPADPFQGGPQAAQVITLPVPSTAKTYLILTVDGRAFEAQETELAPRPTGGGGS